MREGITRAGRWNNRALVRLMWPLIIEQLLSVLLGVVDTVMVAAVNEAAVSGVSLVDSINVLLITLFTSLAVGGSVVSSQYIGRGDTQNASLAARQLLYITTAMSLVIVTLTLIFQRGILSLVYGNIEREVMDNAITYLWLSAVSYPFMGLYNACAALFRSMGNSRVSMLVAGLVNILNIIGNALFIYGLGMGVAGAALSTLISRGAAAVVMLLLLFHARSGPIRIAGLFKFQFSWEMIKRILRIAIPSALENSVFQIGKILTARIVSSFGTAAIAGNAIASTITSFATLPGSAFGMAMLTVVGQCVGAGDFNAAKKNYKKLMLGTYVAVAAVSGLMAALAGPLVRVFDLSAEGAQLAQSLVYILCGTAPFVWIPSFVTPNALRAAGDAKYTMVVSVACMWLFRIGMAFLLSYAAGLGVAGVWWAMVLDWIVRGVFFIVRWQRGRWQNKRIID